MRRGPSPVRPRALPWAKVNRPFRAKNQTSALDSAFPGHEFCAPDTREVLCSRLTAPRSPSTSSFGSSFRGVTQDNVPLGSQLADLRVLPPGRIRGTESHDLWGPGLGSA